MSGWELVQCLNCMHGFGVDTYCFFPSDSQRIHDPSYLVLTGIKGHIKCFGFSGKLCQKTDIFSSTIQSHHGGWQK